MFELINIFFNLTRSVKLRFLSEIVTKLSNFVIVMVITRSLGISDYGFYVILLTIINGFLPFLSLGLSSTIIKKLSSINDVNEISEKIFNCLKLNFLFFLLLLCLTLIFLILYLEDYLFLGVLTLVSSFSISLQMIFFEVLRSKYLSNNFSFLQILDSIAFLGFLLFTEKMNLINIELILIIFIIVKILTSLFVFRTLLKKSIIRFKFKKQNPSLLKNYINPGIVFVILGVSDWFLNFSDKLIIGFYLDPLQLSIYFTIGLISSSILSLGSIYWWELLPKLNEYQSKDRYDKIFRLIKEKNESFIFLSNILIISLIIFSPLIQNIILNEDIEIESYFYLVFFSSIFFHQISTGWEFFCYIENKGSFVLINSIIWGLFSFFMYVVLIPDFGIYGALFTLFTSKTLSSISLKMYANKLGYKESILKRSFKTYLIPFTSSISFFLISQFLKLINLGIIWNSIIYFTISLVLFCSLFMFFKKNNI